MTQWWEGLSALAKVFYCIAIPSTLVLILQTILLFIGFGDSGAASDLSGDVDVADSTDFSSDGAPSGDFSVGQLFTLQGIMAFLCIFSWVGIICVGASLHAALSILIGFFCGFLAMFGVSKILRLSSKLAENGTVMLENTIGSTATVYVPIPALGTSHGKVMVTVQGRLTEADAVCFGETQLSTGTKVTITDVDGDTLVCKPAEK